MNPGAGRTETTARKNARYITAALIATHANGDGGGFERALSLLKPGGTGIGLEAHTVVELLADIAARSDPRLVQAVTGFPYAPPKRKSAARKGEAA